MPKTVLIGQIKWSEQQSWLIFNEHMQRYRRYIESEMFYTWLERNVSYCQDINLKFLPFLNGGVNFTTWTHYIYFSFFEKEILLNMLIYVKRDQCQYCLWGVQHASFNEHEASYLTIRLNCSGTLYTLLLHPGILHHPPPQTLRRLLGLTLKQCKACQLSKQYCNIQPYRFNHRLGLSEDAVTYCSDSLFCSYVDHVFYMHSKLKHNTIYRHHHN